MLELGRLLGKALGNLLITLLIKKIIVMGSNSNNNLALWTGLLCGYAR